MLKKSGCLVLRSVLHKTKQRLLSTWGQPSLVVLSRIWLGGAHAMGLQAEIFPVFGRPGAIETLRQQVPFVAMIDVAESRGDRADVSVAFCGAFSTATRCCNVS